MDVEAIEEWLNCPCWKRMVLALQDAEQDIRPVVRMARQVAGVRLKSTPDPEMQANKPWWDCDQIATKHPGGDRILCEVIRGIYPMPPEGFSKIGKGGRSEKSGGVEVPRALQVKLWPHPQGQM